MSNMAQYHKALSDGDFPVRWLDKMANYGMPIPLFSQQTVAYLGALFIFIFNNVLLSYNLVVLVFALLSSYAFYYFLREYFDEWSSLIATVLLCFAPYRIINIYIRGALPEFAASFFLPIILLSMKKWLQDKKGIYFYVFVIAIFFLALTHPISLTVYSFIIGFYFLYLLQQVRSIPYTILMIVIGSLVSLGMASFYLIPLLLEFKYLYYGLGGSVFLPNSFLELKNLLMPQWYYFTSGDILTRGHYLHIGIVELFVLIGGFVYIIGKLIYRRKVNIIFLGAYLLLFLYLVLITKLGTPIFTLIGVFGNIQHQWRLLSGIIFLPPFIFAYLLSKFNYKTKMIVGSMVVLVIVLLRFPQLYGKNYVATDDSVYLSSRDNLYAQVMNTIWTGPTQSYPVKKVKGEIIEGRGKIVKRIESNSWRTYDVIAESPEIRLVDNTFYFPGWKVYVDHNETPIEFQDMNYRGVITYRIPAGRHTVEVRFTNTKVRLLANVVSLLSIGVLGLLIIFKKRLLHHPAKKRA